ncbi:ABC transporter ATP-binding protein [Kitasatospora atroaurantiaca]|uniref:ATP-binding cassette subfamily B protein n=1 Tax=Kitasatospora atroaurantiaca TaxID=285545 RepID=A0A561ERJ5_9ACTN|nr:ABC transporter ATP-binding protein [Kitasatospora atroaurantiaca]TWE18204.1 ATP-binding cassette subfamily B protein [Kitasatospora atroaurantiaca]
MNETRASASRLLWKESRPVRPVAAGALGVLTVSVLATLAGPLLVQYFVDRATVGSSQSLLVMVAVWYLVVALVGGASRIGAGYLAVQAGWRVADSLRMRLLRHAAVERPVLDVESRPVGEVLEKVEGNADIVGKAISESGFGLISNVAVVLGTVTAMFIVVPAAGIGISVLVIGVCFLMSRLSRRSVKRWELAREQQAKLFGFVGDSLAARDDLVLLGESTWATERTRTNLAALFNTERRAYISGRAFWPLTQLCFAVAFGLGFGLGLHNLQQGTISIGTLTMIYLYVDLLQRPLEEMSSQAGQMQQMMAVLTMASRSLESHPAEEASESASERAAVTLPEGPLEVAFEKVTFGYGDVPVLSDVSFTVAPGRSLGIVGPTGSGKSTVINLLCGLAGPDQGRVLIGGVDVHQLPPAEFARRVTVLSQRAHVFTATVRENVTLFDEDIPRERVWEVLEQLNAAGWVRELPDGLETRVGAGARALSEGEMQVLAGARALIRPYSLLIVDEGTSRFDPETERSWSALLDTVMRDRTVVMVEHRLGTLRGVDEVMAMKSGRVVEIVAAHEGGTR